MNLFHIVVSDARNNESHFYWRSASTTNIEQEVFEHFGQTPVFVERIK